VVEVGCIGLCSAEPIVDVQLPGRMRVAFGPVAPTDVPDLLDRMLARTVPAASVIGQQRTAGLEPWPGVGYLDEHPFFAPQTRWVLANCGVADPSDIDEYIARGGYEAFAGALDDPEKFVVVQLAPAVSVSLVEEFCPDFIENLSVCKSPQQMLGALIKTHFAEQARLDPSRIFSVAVTPCTAAKFEAQRPEMGRGGRPDVDAVLTTRELARLIRMRGMDLSALAPEPADAPFGERSTAGKLTGAAGGLTEAVMRAAHFLLAGKDLPNLRIPAVRAPEGVKEVRLRMGKLELGVAVVSGLGNARGLLDEIRAGWRLLHFVEVATCPGGCVAGGGQPLGASGQAVRARAAGTLARRVRVRVWRCHSERAQRVEESRCGCGRS
jgi:iron only hydrogenase large subunit-like protein